MHLFVLCVTAQLQVYLSSFYSRQHHNIARIFGHHTSEKDSEELLSHSLWPAGACIQASVCFQLSQIAAGSGLTTSRIPHRVAPCCVSDARALVAVGIAAAQTAQGTAQLRMPLPELEFLERTGASTKATEAWPLLQSCISMTVGPSKCPLAQNCRL